MKDIFFFANLISFLVLFFLTLELIYYVVKTAVRKRMLQTNEDLVEAEKIIARSILQLKHIASPPSPVTPKKSETEKEQRMFTKINPGSHTDF